MTERDHSEKQSGARRRVTLVTGGTAGIGRAVALELARGGDRVLFVGRNIERGRAALHELREVDRSLDPVFLPADLSLLADAASVVDRLREHTDRLDAVVLCAGILSTIPEWTPEGLERNFVLNYLSRYLMIRQLLPELGASPSGRIVLVANAGKYGDSLDLEDLQHRRGRPGLVVAARTQFANDLLTSELHARLQHTRIAATCVFPGVVRTEVFSNARGLPWFMRALAGVLPPLIAISPPAAARTPAALAQHAELAASGGSFYGPALRQLKVPARARAGERSRRLWEASDELVRPYLGDSISALAQRSGEQDRHRQADQRGGDAERVDQGGARRSDVAALDGAPDLRVADGGE
jgi:NAD(P)-dependent dehydrogenase (short-subunit alcohol dehydrogenase family)